METPDPKPPTLLSCPPLSLPPYSGTVGNDEASPAAAESTNLTDPTTSTDASDILPPAVLVLAGQSIHAESDPDVPLYQVNRGLASLGPATRLVELERLERRPSSQTKQRPRHIYNLRSAVSLLRPFPSTKRLEYYIQAVSSRWAPAGHLGLKESRSPFKEHWTALPVCIRRSAFTVFDAERPAAVFEARYRRGVCTWTDAHGQEVALQYETSAAGATTSPRLLVTASLRRDLRDALVALWCCYVWEQSVNRHHPVPTPRTKSPYFQGHMFR